MTAALAWLFHDPLGQAVREGAVALLSLASLCVSAAVWLDMRRRGSR